MNVTLPKSTWRTVYAAIAKDCKFTAALKLIAAACQNDKADTAEIDVWFDVEPELMLALGKACSEATIIRNANASIGTRDLL